MNTTVKTLIFWIVILISALALWQVVKGNGPTAPEPEISYSQFLSQIDSGTIAKVRISGTTVEGTYRNGHAFRVYVPASQEQMLDSLRKGNVEVWYSEGSPQSGLGWLINSFAPLALLAVLWFFMIRQMKAKTNFEQARTNMGGTSQFGSV
jgi:cell division protease FtsH